MNPLFGFAENKNSRKNSIFIIHGEAKISYSEFNEKVNSTSNLLKNSGIKKGDHIAVVGQNSFDYILIIFSLWKLNAVPVPINLRLLQKEIEKKIIFADCKFVLVDRNLHLRINHKSFNIILFPSKDESKTNTFEKNKRYNKNNTALIMFTSGSSGKNKAVMLSFENLIQSASIGNQVLNQNKKDRWLASLPFYHIGGFSIIVRACLSGASVIIPHSLNTNDIAFAIKKYKPTLASLVSTQLKRLIDNNIKPNKELKNVLIGGGFTSAELSVKAVKKEWKITKVYGSTEVSSFISAINFKEIPNKPGSSGKALHPNKILIVNEKKEVVASNISGEIIIKSPTIMKGYYTPACRYAGKAEKDLAETSKKIINKFYYTGDIGYLDDEGYLFIEARCDDMIISGGEKIFPKEVESAILTYPFINEAFVLGIKNSEWGQEVSAVVVIKKNKKIKSGDLIKFLKDKLPGYKIPKKIFFIDNIPKTSLGKVQKEKLRQIIGIKQL